MAKPKKERKLSEMQILLGIHLKELGLEPDYEYAFSDKREWRIDVMIHEARVGIEISGGNWSGGHRRGAAQEDEYDKLNEAAMRGIRILQFTNAMVADGRAKDFIKQYI